MVRIIKPVDDLHIQYVDAEWKDGCVDEALTPLVVDPKKIVNGRFVTNEYDYAVSCFRRIVVETKTSAVKRCVLQWVKFDFEREDGSVINVTLTNDDELEYRPDNFFDHL